jgi:hypothetical protein
MNQQLERPGVSLALWERDRPLSSLRSSAKWRLKPESMNLPAATGTLGVMMSLWDLKTGSRSGMGHAAGEMHSLLPEDDSFPEPTWGSWLVLDEFTFLFQFRWNLHNKVSHFILFSVFFFFLPCRILCIIGKCYTLSYSSSPKLTILKRAIR